MQVIQGKYGGSAAYYPHRISDDDGAIMDDLSRIVGYYNDSFYSLTNNPVGFGVSGASLLGGVGVVVDRQDRKFGKKPGIPIGRRTLLKWSLFLPALGAVGGGAMGGLVSYGKSFHATSDLNNAKYVDSKIAELYKT